MNLDNTKQFLYDFISRVTGLTVIEDLQGKPRPQLPYVSYRFLNAGVRVGSIDETRYDRQSEKFSANGLRVATVSINIFGKGANDTMSKLLNSLDLPENVDAFANAGVAHIGEDGPNDLSELMETKYQERSQMDLRLSYGETTESTVGPIEHVEIEGEIAGQGQNESVEIDLEINRV